MISCSTSSNNCLLTAEGKYANELLAQPNANKMNNTPVHSQENVTINNWDQREFDHFFQERQDYSNQIVIVHLNINSLQNKFDKLKLLNEKILSFSQRQRSTSPTRTASSP